MIKSTGTGFLMVDALNIIRRSLLVVHIQILSGLPNKLKLAITEAMKVSAIKIYTRIGREIYVLKYCNIFLIPNIL